MNLHMLTRRAFSTVTLSTVATLALACSTAPKTDSGRMALEQEASATVTKMTAKDSSLSSFLARYPGYVVFPSIGEGAVIAGGGYGHGVVYQNGQAVGYADMTKASIGASLGGQSYSEVIVFETADRLNQFKTSPVTFTANASAVAVKAGAAAATQFKDGVAVFADSDAGLMAEASVGGQRFTYQGR